MLTFFTTAKPFRGHDAIIQRNALKSWTLLHPEVEVILFGDDAGAAEVCVELGLYHEPYVERHESGTKYLNYMFARAQKISRHNYVCFSNCDIILFSDFWKAFEKILLWQKWKHLLLVGQRTDTDITEPISFGHPGWDLRLREFAKAYGLQMGPKWIDFFLFPKGLYLDMPSLIVGHGWWDGWMIWKALSDGIPVLDVSPCVLAVHQNHGYAAEFGRVYGGGADALSQVNLERIAGLQHNRSMAEATHLLTPAGIRRNRRRWLALATRTVPPPNIALIRSKVHWALQTYLWHPFLNLTRPIRRPLGLRQKSRPPRS
jgi:hypothetical protein